MSICEEKDVTLYQNQISITMEPSIYSFSLCTALPLMLFFGFYFLFAKTPEKKIFKNYLRSRQIMGIAMLLLSANYSVHFFFGIRFKNADSAILMNMSTYFLCYSLFSSALIMLLDRFYITKRRVWTHIILWIIFSTLSGVVLFLLPSGIMQKISLFALAVWLIVFGVVLARRVIIAYRRAIRIFNETQADDIGAYIEWLSIFTYWAVIFGVGCGLLTFLPDKYVFIWILSSIPFYSYLFYSYQNYLLFYEQVENAFEQDIQSEQELLTNSGTEPEMVSEEEVPVSYTRNFALHYLHTLPMYLRRYCLNFEMYYIHWVLMQLTPYLFVSFPSNNKFIAIRFTTSTLTAFPKALNALAIVSGYSANSSIH